MNPEKIILTHADNGYIVKWNAITNVHSELDGVLNEIRKLWGEQSPADSTPESELAEGQQTECDGESDCGCCSCTKAKRRYSKVKYGCINFDDDNGDCQLCQSQGTLEEWLKLDCFDGDEI